MGLALRIVFFLYFFQGRYVVREEKKYTKLCMKYIQTPAENMVSNMM